MHILRSVFLVLALAIGPAAAQDIPQAVRQIDSLARQGKWIEVLGALDDIAAAVWERAPLTFRQAVWVNDRAAAFGNYTPRANTVFPAGAALIAYAEPVGFGWRRAGDGWRTELIADVKITGSDGRPLFDQADFMKVDLASRVKNREVMVNFTFNARGAWPRQLSARNEAARRRDRQERQLHAAIHGSLRAERTIAPSTASSCPRLVPGIPIDYAPPY